MATQTETQRRTAARKAAATRKRNQTARSARSTQASARRTASSAERTAESGAGFAGTRVEALASQAERAVLIPVGAALVALKTWSRRPSRTLAARAPSASCPSSSVRWGLTFAATSGGA